MINIVVINLTVLRKIARYKPDRECRMAYFSEPDLDATVIASDACDLFNQIAIADKFLNRNLGGNKIKEPYPAKTSSKSNQSRFSLQISIMVAN